MKTSITQIAIANDRLYSEVGLLMKMESRAVQQMTRFVGKYIARTIERGQMEAVMLPYFGKFKPKRSLKVQDKILAHERNGMDIIYRAIKGRNVLDLRDKTTYDQDRLVKRRKP